MEDESRGLFVSLKLSLVEDRRSFEEYYPKDPGCVLRALSSCKHLALLHADAEPESVPLPRWLFDAVIAIVQDDLKQRPFRKGKGRQARYGEASRQMMTDLARFLAVEQCRSRGIRGEAAFREAQKILKGKDAAGFPKTIKRSHLRVRRQLSAQPR